ASAKNPTRAGRTSQGLKKSLRFTRAIVPHSGQIRRVARKRLFTAETRRRREISIAKLPTRLPRRLGVSALKSLATDLGVMGPAKSQSKESNKSGPNKPRAEKVSAIHAGHRTAFGSNPSGSTEKTFYRRDAEAPRNLNCKTPNSTPSAPRR